MYKEDELYAKYKTTGHVNDRTRVLMALKPVLFKKHQQLAGTLPDSALKAEISHHANTAIDTYDPTKGAKLSTHVFNQIAQASRLNYQYQNIVRMSEDKQQGKFKHYKKAIDDLNSELLREPTTAEIAKRLSWTDKEVEDMKGSIFADISESSQTYAPVASEFNDDATKLQYVKSKLDDMELKILNDKAAGKSQADMVKDHGMDINKLNYTSRKLTEKVKGLLERYDGK